MTNERLKSIKELISDDELEKALAAMAHFDTGGNEVIGMKGRLSDLKNEKMRGLIASSDYTLNRNQIRDGILMLVDKFENSILSEKPVENSNTKQHVEPGEARKNKSRLKQKPMYRESWASAQKASTEHLSIHFLLSTCQELGRFRAKLNGLDENLSGFKSELSGTLNEIDSFLKETETAVKKSGNEGHRIYQLAMEVKSKSSEVRKQLLKASNTSSKGRDALARLCSNDLIYFDYSMEKLEMATISVLKNEFGIHPN